ncbi:MAG: maleylpyruvate isomerase family mycothiol-dependent enzyme [Galactobacter sp.]
MDLVDFSRDLLAETLLAAGPSASTLCTGWQTRHLAAHLVLRERLSMLNPFVRDGERQLQLMAARAEDPGAYARLVIEFREGSGARPLRWPGVDSLANLLEYFVHTEDVRRARRVAPQATGPQFRREAVESAGPTGRSALSQGTHRHRVGASRRPPEAGAFRTAPQRCRRRGDPRRGGRTRHARSRTPAFGPHHLGRGAR